MERGYDRSFVQIGDPPAAFYVKGWFSGYLSSQEPPPHDSPSKMAWLLGRARGMLAQVRIERRRPV
jgi:hypothetical protein